MASVHLARDTELDRRVAVKLLAEGLSDDETFHRRFVREARLAARLSHPNVVSVYDAGEDDGRPYIVMEYVEGETLADVVARRGRFPPEEARGIALQAARRLAHAHGAGLVHRDVKPQNLILRADGTLKIADFGIARAAEATALTQAGTILGTAAYLAPEQALGEEVTAAADVYSLGAVLYELLTGRPPFEAASLADLAERQRKQVIPPVRERAPGVPGQLEDVVGRCLARDPAARPASGRELEDELSGGATVPTRVAPAPETDRRLLWLALAGVIALAAVLLAVALAGRGSGKRATRPPPASTPAIPRGSSPEEQARNIAGWLRRHSGPQR